MPSLPSSRGAAAAEPAAAAGEAAAAAAEAATPAAWNPQSRVRRAPNAEKLMTMKATTPAMPAMSSEPAKNQAAAPTTPAPTTDPPTLPRIERSIAPMAGTATSRIRASVPISKPWAGAPRRACAGGNGLPSLTTLMMRSTPAWRPAANCPCCEQRRDGLGNDAVRGDVGQHALQAVADLDANLLVVLCDQQQRAVVLALLSDLPRLGDANANRLRSAPAGWWGRSESRADWSSAPPNRPV